MVTQLDTLVARGNTSDVYRWGTGAVIKVLHPQIPADWADREAQIAGRVHAAGLPAPAVLDLTTVGGRPAIIFELIDGPSMWEQMLAHPEEIGNLSRNLAALQADVNATEAPIGIPSLNTRLLLNIQSNPILEPGDRAAAVMELGARPDGNLLCHFDVHPNNVLIGPSGPMIIDWFDAAAGTPEADIVRSSVLMRPDAANSHLACPDPSLISLMHDEYIAAALTVNDVDIDELTAWEPSVLASRLAEPLADDCRLAADRAWHERRGSRPTALTNRIDSFRSSIG